MKSLFNYFLVTSLAICCIACNSNSSADDSETKAGRTPVTACNISKGDMMETVSVSATSQFQLKSPVKSTAAGYISNLKVHQGDYVNKGELLMTITTKEAQSLGSSISKIDSSFHFNGQINITAQSNGYVFQLGYQNGDYVQDGELVMNICDVKSFVFIMNLPYELSAIAAKNYSVQLLLPDSTTLIGTIDKAMPTLDAATQTQQYVIHVSSQKLLPENLLATVLLVKQNKPNTTSLPHSAVLTDETQSDFWVMKMLNDSVAVKVPVSIGIQNETLDEILSPQFSVDDRILISGNYGLDDTAKVILEK